MDLIMSADFWLYINHVLNYDLFSSRLRKSPSQLSMLCSRRTSYL